MWRMTTSFFQQDVPCVFVSKATQKKFKWKDAISVFSVLQDSAETLPNDVGNYTIF